MTPTDWISLGSLGVNAGLGLFGAFNPNMNGENAYKLATENFDLQKQNLEYQKNLQQTLFDREDNAYQRTVSDMRAAGLSPLALSSVNGAGSAVATEAPQNSAQPVNKLASYMQTLQFLGNMTEQVSKISNNLASSNISSLQGSLLSKENSTYYEKYGLDYRKALAEALTTEANLNDFLYDRAYMRLFGITSSMSKEERLFQILKNVIGINTNQGDFRSRPADLIDSGYGQFYNDNSVTLPKLINALKQAVSSDSKNPLDFITKLFGIAG